MYRIVLIASLVLSASCSVEQVDLPAADTAAAVVVQPILPMPTMSDYLDPQLGYAALVPADWRRVVVAEAEQGSFSVSFESPPSDAADRFADYLMIEIFPGPVAGVFEQLPDDRTPMLVDGQQVFRQRYTLNNYPVRQEHLDLVAWQINLSRAGYSVLMYAVGERREDSRLERILIEFAHSFSLPDAPFRVS